MNRLLLALCSLVLVFTACQKENSFEKPIPAEGSLWDDMGDCMLSIVNGVYTSNLNLADTNTVIVSVIVTKPGAYTITTDTVNGYSFRATGSFATADTFPVILKGSGRPLAPGTDVFMVKFNNTICSFQVPVLQGPTGGGGGGNTAVYTLSGAPNACMNATVNGNYASGTALTSANNVVVNVNVTTPGTWSITTPAVGGITFTGSGNFTATGAQTIVLNATGTPNTGGAQTFTVNTGTSTCTFQVTVTGGTTPPPSGVYFPMTMNSYWTYEDDAGDTLIVTNVGSTTFGGTAYSRFVTNYQPSGGVTVSDTVFYRKSATNAYFIRFDTSGLGQAGLRFTAAAYDVEFLRDAMTTGQVITTNINANFQPQGSPIPIAVTLRFTSTCVNANASYTSSLGTTFTNVYEIDSKAEIILPGGVPPIPIPDLELTRFYARGVGLVGMLDDTNTNIQDIRYWRVN